MPGPFTKTKPQSIKKKKWQMLYAGCWQKEKNKYFNIILKIAPFHS